MSTTPDLRPAQLLAEATHSDEVSLTFTRDLTLAETITVGRAIAHQHDKTLWWIGDWARYVKRKHGHHYDVIVEATGLAMQTVKNAASVAGQFQHSYRQRYAALSFSHFSEVAPFERIEDQEYWLNLAVEEGLTVKRLREMIAADAIEGAPTGGPDSELVRLATLSLRYSEERVEAWRRAAERDGVEDVREWVASVLDEAAEQRLAA